MPVLTPDTAIFLAGHRGMVGSAILRKLRQKGSRNVVTRSRQELDLLDQAAVAGFFSDTPVDYVSLAAARVGGLAANNTYPADFIYENLAIQNNGIENARRAGVGRLLFLGSSRASTLSWHRSR